MFLELDYLLPELSQGQSTQQEETYATIYIVYLCRVICSKLYKFKQTSLGHGTPRFSLKLALGPDTTASSRSPALIALS